MKAVTIRGAGVSNTFRYHNATEGLPRKFEVMTNRGVVGCFHLCGKLRTGTMPASYGTVPSGTAPVGAFVVADTGALRWRRAGLGVAVAALLAAVGLVALALTAAGHGRTELNVYQSKYRDVHVGGVWLDCLKCRHASGHCHPTKSEAEGRRRMDANACPPHTGMTTVLMKRNGQIETKWIDEAVLECAMKKMGESMAPPAADAEDEEPAEEPAEEEEEAPAAPFCVRPSIGERAKWEASEDCASVADWLKGMGVYGDEPAEEPAEAPAEEPAEETASRRRLLAVAPRRLQQLEGEEAAADEWDPAGKTPIEKWVCVIGKQNKPHGACRRSPTGQCLRGPECLLLLLVSQFLGHEL